MSRPGGLQMRTRSLVPYRIQAARTAQELLQSFHPHAKKLIKEALKELKHDPFLGKNLQRELSGYQSYRINRYRIIYKTDLSDKIVMVHYVGHRRDVYERFVELVRMK